MMECHILWCNQYLVRRGNVHRAPFHHKSSVLSEFK